MAEAPSGFDFLGYNIRQFPAGKYVSARNRYKGALGFNTFIIPSKDACKRHQARISDIIRKHKSSPQAQLILELNPVIRGWCNYYKFSDSQTRNILTTQDHLVFQKLRAWGQYRCGNLKDARKNIIQKSVREIGYSQPGKGMRTPFGYFHIVISVAVRLNT